VRSAWIRHISGCPLVFWDNGTDFAFSFLHSDATSVEQIVAAYKITMQAPAVSDGKDEGAAQAE
jgi:hypothetical protein